MSKTATVHSRIDGKVKIKAEKILKTIGLGPSDAIDIFYRQIILHRGVPFPVEIPNEETLKAMRDIEKGKGVKSFNSVEELMKDLQS